MSGKLVGVTLWDRPVASPGETGSNTGYNYSTDDNCRVDIYQEFIIVTPPTKPSVVAPHGWYTNLRFEKD
jgi:hypothetical protein